MQGKNESLRARAILRSLVPLEDLVGALSLRFTLQPLQRPGEPPKRDVPPGELCLSANKCLVVDLLMETCVVIIQVLCQITSKVLYVSWNEFMVLKNGIYL